MTAVGMRRILKFPNINSPPPLPELRLWRSTSTFPVSFSPQGRETKLDSHLSTCGREGNIHTGASLHAYIIKNPPFVGLGDAFSRKDANLIYNCLLDMYCKCGELGDAVKLFDEMPLKDTISWNSLTSSLLRIGDLEMGFAYFKSLIGSSIYRFDQASLTTVLSACGRVESVGMVQMIHALVILNGYEKEITVANSLITSYFKCQSCDSGLHVFDEMEEKNVVSWTAALSGLAQNKFYSDSLNLFAKMYHGSVSPNNFTYLSALQACSGLRALKEGAQIHGFIWKLGIQTDVCIESALMDMYSKCSSVDEAWRIFESAEVFDEVSITVLLVGFAQNGLEEEAVQMFLKMMKEGGKIDPDMISAILGIFGSGISQGLGLQIHSWVIKKGFVSNIYVSNGLINMYSKCGELDESVKVFEWMPRKNHVSWNSVIAAFARHGDGFKALQFYEVMRSKDVEPTDVTFLSLLHACSHVGLIEKGMEFLNSMEKEYGMCPRMEHYASMVDMLGRAGLLREAKSFIELLPEKPEVLLWQALLGACSIYNNVDMGKYAAEQLAKVAPDSPVPYVSMANIYSYRGRWKDRARLIKKMKERGVVKETGVSWIEIDKKIHSFVVADQIHPQGDDVYQVLFNLLRHMRDETQFLDDVFVQFYCHQDEIGGSGDGMNPIVC